MKAAAVDVRPSREQAALNRHPFHAHLASVLACSRCMETFWRAMERLREMERAP